MRDAAELFPKFAFFLCNLLRQLDISVPDSIVREHIAGVKSHRLAANTNVGRPGRGHALLTDRQKARIRQIMVPFGVADCGCEAAPASIRFPPAIAANAIRLATRTLWNADNDIRAGHAEQGSSGHHREGRDESCPPLHGVPGHVGGGAAAGRVPAGRPAAARRQITGGRIRRMHGLGHLRRSVRDGLDRRPARPIRASARKAVIATVNPVVSGRGPLSEWRPGQEDSLTDH